MELRGKTVVVTGATGGIGGALVDALLDAGAARVWACDIGEAADRSSARVAPRRLDVTDEAGVAALADDAHDASLVINCHGVAVQQGYLTQTTLDAFRREMEINYWGQVLMCRTFAPILAQNDGGAVVNFLSPLAYVTFPFVAPYCATKAACRVLTEALRAELRGQGTLVMGVCPGTIDTGMMSKLDIPKSPPAEVARAVVAGLLRDETEVWAGEGAEEMRRRLREDPDAIAAEAATQLGIPGR